MLDLLTPVVQCPEDMALALAEVFRSGLDHTMIVFVTGPAGPSTLLRSADKLSVVRIGVGSRRRARHRDGGRRRTGVRPAVATMGVSRLRIAVTLGARRPLVGRGQ